MVKRYLRLLWLTRLSMFAGMTWFEIFETEQRTNKAYIGESLKQSSKLIKVAQMITLYVSANIKSAYRVTIYKD